MRKKNMPADTLNKNHIKEAVISHMTTSPCTHQPRCAACGEIPDGEQILRELLSIVGSDAYAMTALTLGGYRSDLGTTIAQYLNLYPNRHALSHRTPAPN
ncbi:hypothetical protein [Massilia antarctica]|uniref:hypothetical protein n=1 Tax=Massilia antarctica TaxID=2765360 RepID=UPI00226ED16E|nr:hypothetical protein [Massilia sp. H27-R4]MCY0916445.1 hypothetical protein [Massilia sp. H27-R4]